MKIPSMAPKPETIVYSNGRIVDGRRHIPNGHLITQGAAIVAVGSEDPKGGASSGSVPRLQPSGRRRSSAGIEGGSGHTGARGQAIV
jgi:hypothetical protein